MRKFIFSLIVVSLISLINTHCYAVEINYKVTWSNDVTLPFEAVSLPNISSDGRQLIFLRNNDSFNEIWSVNTDGTTPKVLISETETEYSSPKWSPDSTKIIFLKNSGYEMWKINSDGTGEAPLTEKKYEKMNPVWWPDGSKIIFYKGAPLNPDHKIEVIGLYILNLADNSLSPFGEPEWDGPVTFSTDAKTLLILDGQDILLLNSDGTIKEKRTIKSPLTHGEEPVWTPDGRYIILGNLLYVIATGEEVPFLPDSVVRYKEAGKPDLVGPSSITLSKDGKKIAFLMEEPNSKTYRARIKVMDLIWK